MVGPSCQTNDIRVLSGYRFRFKKALIHVNTHVVISNQPMLHQSYYMSHILALRIYFSQVYIDSLCNSIFVHFIRPLKLSIVNNFFTRLFKFILYILLTRLFQPNLYDILILPIYFILLHFSHADDQASLCTSILVKYVVSIFSSVLFEPRDLLCSSIFQV